MLSSRPKGARQSAARQNAVHAKAVDIGLALGLSFLSFTSSALAQPVSEESPEVATADDAASSTASEPEVARDGSDVEPPPTGAVEGPEERASTITGLAHPRYSSAAVAPTVDVIEPPVASPPLVATAEVYLGFAPSYGFGLGGVSGGLGGLAGLEGVGLSGHADFAFAATQRVFLGLGLAVSHSDTGDASVTLRTDRVEVPLIAQFYFDDPRRGAAVPTLRIVPAFRWDERAGSTYPSYTSAGGRLDVAVGVTWFMVDWLALRFMGDVGASVSFAYQGPAASSAGVYVAADIGVVIRL